MLINCGIIGTTVNKTTLYWLPLIGLLLLGGCAARPPAVDAGTVCVAKTFTVTDAFEGARRGRCAAIGAANVRIDIRAEDDWVTNDSPWFAFKLTPSQPGVATVTMRYYGAAHRYWPKTSNDGITWTRLAEDRVGVSRNGKRAKLSVPLGDQPVWVAAQELITTPIYDAWTRRAASDSNIDSFLLGHSRKGRPIAGLDSNAAARDVLLIVGRQHPPEVSGAVAFFPFAETLFADSELARQFRSRFRIIAVPILNPDGVIAGHWRHNLGETDLNRDWGPFAQPETQAMQTLLDDLDASGAKIRMFADFHSTKRNLLYTQSAEFPTDPPGFTPTWLSNTEKRLGNYSFTNEAAPVSDQANSKNYMFKRYGIPAVTFEVGDETDRAATRAAAVVFAEELMKLLLSQDY